MKYLRFILPVFMFVALVACGDKQTSDVANFYKIFHEVNDVHDEMMPQMGTLSELRRELEEKIEASEEALPEYEKAVQDLADARQSMMDWMKDFGKEFPYMENRMDGLNAEQILDHIERIKLQKVSVDAMKDKMVESMENAKAILGK